MDIRPGKLRTIQAAAAAMCAVGVCAQQLLSPGPDPSVPACVVHMQLGPTGLSALYSTGQMLG